MVTRIKGYIMENKHKHLEFIQGIIERMARNSFALKGWAVTLVAGIFALASKDSEKLYFLIAYVPIIIFWGLDSFYLMKERLFRSLYDRIRLMDEESIDFSMKTTNEERNMGKNKWFNCLISKTEAYFYLPLALIVSAIIFLPDLLICLL